MGKNLINCDLGECLQPNPDAQIMPLIDMANIACGGHVGDDESMIKTIALAKQNNVRIGAHPSYADKANFGRISHPLDEDALYALIKAQIGHFQTLCQAQNAKLEYIKPHGALYHDMMKDPKVIEVLIHVIEQIDPQLDLVVQAGFSDYLQNFEKNTNVRLLHEVFADRAYEGMQMLPRSENNAVFDNAERIAQQFHDFSSENSFKIDTICFHGDNPASIQALKIVKNA